VVTAVYHTKSLVGLTQYEPWHRQKPAVHHMRVFGCRAYVQELSLVNKLVDQSYVVVFIGYAEGVKPYRILDLAARQLCTTQRCV
jgi:hypothetical protein